MRSRILVVVALVACGLVASACGPKEEFKNTSAFVDTSTAAAASPTAPAAAPTKFLEVGNVYGVRTGAKAPTFTLTNAATITEIDDYHYIVGGGPTPGTIGLKAEDGTMYGPWPCVGLDGQGNVKNATWKATPNADVPAGTYTVVDSGPDTWSTNDQAKGLGFVSVLGFYK